MEFKGSGTGTSKVKGSHLGYFCNSPAAIQDPEMAALLTLKELKKLVTENYPEFPVKGLSKKKLLDKICSRICPSTKFTGAPNVLEHFVPIPDAEESYELNGQRATITDKVKIASGKEGTVYQVELTTTDGKKALLAMKMATHNLDEGRIINDHVGALKCPGILPMKIGEYRGKPALFMPLADGDLSKLLGTLTHEQADNIINVLKKALMCLSEIGVYYFDIKPQNIVYHCKNAAYSTIYLTDMSSAIPTIDGDYIATHPPPIDAVGDMYQKSDAIFGYVSILKDGAPDKELAMKIYTYQLSILYCWLLTPGTSAPTYMDRGEPHAVPYYLQLMTLAKNYNAATGKKDKYYDTLYNMFNDTKEPLKWSLDNIIPLNEF